MERQQTRQIKVKDVYIGGQNKVIIQSMCSIKTSEVESVVQQIQQLESAGCEIVRLSIMDEADAQAISQIKQQTSLPLVADIHFDYRLALKAIASGIDKIRINPGNIGSRDKVEAVVNACKEKQIPIRIGVNGGSLEKDIYEKYGKLCPEALIESAKHHVDILEELDFYDICLSFKSSDPSLCIETYKLASATFDYPLHLGVTEAGTLLSSAIKSSYALGYLLHEGIGDTIRISVNGDPKDEMKVVKQLLHACHLKTKVPNLIACPMCGRTAWEMIGVVNEIESYLSEIESDVCVAIMGCVVNGPGEAKHADIAIAGGRNEGVLIRRGQIIEKVKQEDMVDRLKQEIDRFVSQEKQR